MDRTNVIGEKIKALRTTKEISIDELAERAQDCRQNKSNASNRTLTSLHWLRS